MGRAKLEQIVARTNAAAPDIVLLLGDFVPSHRIKKWSGHVPHDVWAKTLSQFDAPLGTHAVLGNHDWWEDVAVQENRSGPTRAGDALQKAGIAVFENDVVRLAKDGQPFWLAGLGSQWAFWPSTLAQRRQRIPYTGMDDLPGTMAKITDAAPVVLMAHEPDIFPSVTDRVSLTISGHTHGGQVQLFGYAPIVPSRFGRRFLYGQIVEDDRHLIVSGGLGMSGLPVRFGRPPEIVIIDVGAEKVS